MSICISDTGHKHYANRDDIILLDLKFDSEDLSAASIVDLDRVNLDS